jgi:rhombotail lipoprotein
MHYPFNQGGWITMKIKLIKSSQLLICILVSVLFGCAQQSGTKSSVVDYLYPKNSKIIVQPSMPTLNIPISVGIAFVPDPTSQSRGASIWPGAMGTSALTEAKKEDLLEKVAENFRGLDFVDEIEVIPSAYLTPGGSFSNLEQIRTMYGVDVIALVSYDQVQFTDEGALSLSYWTIVGAYVFQGEKNDTSTMIDTVVYDIQSKTMLFRAPGTSNIKGVATPVNLSEELREDSIKSFEEATINMIANLDAQLSKFKEKIKRNPEKFKVVSRGGSTGGGAFGIVEISSMLILLFTANARNKIRRIINKRSARPLGTGKG